MSELLRLLRDQGLVTPFQAIVLVIVGYLVVTSRVNIPAVVSSILIVSTFSLQAVRGRFLLLYPRNNWAGWETSEWDTYYLRILIIVTLLLSVFALFLGVADAAESWGLQFDDSTVSVLVLGILVIVFVGLIPLLWAIFSAKLNNRIVQKLQRKYGPFSLVRRCPFCQKGYAVETHRVLDTTHGSLSLECKSCSKKDEERPVSLNIGEVQPLA